MMKGDALTSCGTTRHAAFDAAGRLLSHSPGFLTDGDAGAYLDRFTSVGGAQMPAARDAALAAWRTDGAALEALLPGAGGEMLLSHAGADGGLVLAAAPLPEREPDPPRARDLLADALRTLSEGFALFDEEARLVICNERYREINEAVAPFIEPGVYWETILRESARRGVPVKAIGREGAWLREILHLGDSYASFEIERSDGSVIGVTVHPTSLGGFTVSEADVTARRRAEAQARESEAMLRSILEGSPANLCMSRISSGEIIYASPASTDLFGKDRSAREQFADAGARADFLTELLPTGRVDDFTAEARNAKGEVFPALFSARIIEFRGEEVMVSSVVDLTEHYHARAALADANRRLRDAIESLDEGFALYDAEDRLVLWNRRYAELNAHIGEHIRAGVKYADILEAAIASNALLPEEAETVRESGRRRGGVMSPMRFEFEHRSGVWFSVARSPTSDGGFVITRLDITESKRNQAELARQREMLHQSEKLSALGELLAGVAHELNNPLSVVVGHALMLKEEVEEEKAANRIAKISAAADRCARIVRTFLAMARQRPASLERVDVNSVVEAAIDVAGYGLRQKGIAIDLALAPGLPPVMADMDQLAQVFANLIVNAEHELAGQGAAGRLRFTTGLEGDEVRIDVEDNGPGIPEAIRARIFEPFFTTKRVGEGTGIGLAFCHRIIGAHGGEIEAGAAPGGGARFTIRLRPAETEAAAEVEEEAPGLVSSGRVLVVDDEPDVAELVADILSGDGYEVVTALSAADALACLPGDFDIVLSDLNMPGAGGEALLGAITERWPEMAARVGFMTGDTMSDGTQRFLEAAARPCLTKPVAPADLRRMAAAMMAEIREAIPEATP